MQSQLRLTQLRAVRSTLPQRRFLAVPPTTTSLPPSPPSPNVAPTTRVVTSGPTVVTPGAAAFPPPTPGSSTLRVPPTVNTGLPPPPPPPRKTRSFFRRVLIYTTVGALVFYPVSGWLSTQYEWYRDWFTENIPGGEPLADYADDHGWETFGIGTVSKKAVEGFQYVTGDSKTPSVKERAESVGRKVEGDAKSGLASAEKKAGQLRQDAEKKASELKKEAEKKAADAKKGLDKAGAQAKQEASKASATIKGKAEEAKSAASGAAASLREKASEVAGAATGAVASLRETAHEATDKAKALAVEASEKVKDATANVPFNFSEGVEGMVREAEKALGKVEEQGEHIKDALTPASGPRVLPDTQRARPLRPETPPPGYYLAKPASKTGDKADEGKDTLPLLVPQVKEFAAEEPIISQLASTIDSLTTTLSSPSTGLSGGDAKGILSKAQDDLTALSKRLEEVKRTEKARLERTVGDKTAEFEQMLKGKDQERASSEQELKESWEKERSALVDEWRHDLEGELEQQRSGIEQRLREEVVAQGIELQRRWLRSIKTQVEMERGGRLAKLDHLSTSLKQLERITLDNSATLDDNIRLHKIWSALRAVQGKADAGDVTFDDELRVLKSLTSDETNSLIQTTLSALEASGIAQSGVKSFASLSSWFNNSVSPRIHSASLVPAPEEAGVFSHLSSIAVSKVMFRPKAGLVDGNDVGSVLARAEWCLGEKDLDGATREVNSLRGWPAKLAQDWLREARRKLEVQQALEVVGTEATLSSLLLV
ncbi:mitochondrial inner membrane protein Mitofilin [Naematelia encephala]|uniref:MICOS complex subunit MIC60 n=1 Tax=Naematelia encephala TaxID=71784 RepID=A0A1Y2AUZ5_9TREE|nr:mitochondrial inner membrane protein Mitofilin [Naematelia encephala]